MTDYSQQINQYQNLQNQMNQLAVIQSRFQRS